MAKDFFSRIYFWMFLTALIIFSYPVIFIPKGPLELLVNNFHHLSLDVFFKYVTHLGDGIAFALLLIVFLLINYKFAVLTAFCIAWQSIIVSLFKRWLFKGLERPLPFFGEDAQLHLVEGVDVHSYNTFPSGHTATGFAIFGILALYFAKRRPWLGVLLIIISFSVGFSRVYLMQHFFVDIYFGAIFGVLSILLGIWSSELFISEKKLDNLNQKSLISQFTHT